MKEIHLPSNVFDMLTETAYLSLMQNITATK